MIKSDYEDFLKNKLRKQSNLKNLYKDDEKVKQYWEESGPHILEEKEFQEWKKKMLYDHTWQTNIEAIFKYGNFKDGEKILDIGCSWGRIIIGIKKYFPNDEIIGTDIIESVLGVAKKICKKELGKLNKNISFIRAAAEDLKLFPDESFDRVIAVRVMQYVANPKNALKEFKRVTKKGGRVVVVLPNKLNPRQILYYHTKLYTPSEVKNWFLENKFKRIKLGTIRFLPRLKHKPRHDSKLRIFEKLGSDTPILNKFGGLIICSGEK
jgi:ubiquinone/menaquinone biosynthesis C-methylase UbiE